MATSALIRSDSDIQRDVLDELGWEPRVRPHEIGVSVDGGVVTLTGWVDSYAKKWAAERAAHRLRRVRAVANDIEVRVPTSAARTDTEIATAVTRALEWDAFVPVEFVDVTVSNGWVMLRGEVEWEYQRRAAERSVRRLVGVRGVSNSVTVRPRARLSPGEREAQIRAALARRVDTGGERVTVGVQGDEVVLGGTVPSWLEREEAERVAWSAPGVAAVTNHVRVRT
jgi:osmotically-inducible protein OsmY